MRATEPSRADSPLPLDRGQQVRASATNEREVPVDTQVSNEKSSTSIVATDTNTIEIKAEDLIYSVAFLADGEHVVSEGRENKIRQRRVEDGKEVGKPMDAGSAIWDLAVTHDGKWIVCGTEWSSDRLGCENPRKLEEDRLQSTRLRSGECGGRFSRCDENRNGIE
jgi:hypothetical protein